MISCFYWNDFTKINNNKFNTSNTFDKNDNKIYIWSTFVMFPTLFIYFFLSIQVDIVL